MAMGTNSLLAMPMINDCSTGGYSHATYAIAFRNHINGQVQLTQLPRSCQRPTQHTSEHGRACKQKD